MQPTKLTEAFIRQLAFEGKPVVVRDTIVKGLMVAVNKQSKSFKVQRDLWVGLTALTPIAVRRSQRAQLAGRVVSPVAGRTV